MVDPAGSEPSDQIREDLVSAATEVFAEQGYSGAGVHQIAARAGLTTGAIYGRFRGKDDLLLEAIQDSIPDGIEALLSGEIDEDPASILSQLGSHALKRDKSAFILLEAISAARREEELGQRLASLLDKDTIRVNKLISQAKADGLIDSKFSSEAVATFVHAVGFGMMVIKVLERDLPSDRDWDCLLGALIAAVAPTTSPDSSLGTTQGSS